MPGDPLAKVQPGAPLRIPAAAYNLFVDGAKEFQGRQHQRLQDRQAGGARDAGIVLVRNDSGAARAKYEVLGIDEPIFDPTSQAAAFKLQPAISGVEPTADHAGKFVVLLEPAADGAFAHAIAAGVTPVQITVASDTTLHLCEATSGQCGYLTAGTTGTSEILWRAGGTGVQWAFVRIGSNFHSALSTVQQIITGIAIEGTDIVAETADMTITNGVIVSIEASDDITLEGTECA